MDDEQKKQVLEEWHSLKRMGRVTMRLLWSAGRWVVGVLMLWDVTKDWWKK